MLSEQMTDLSFLGPERQPPACLGFPQICAFTPRGPGALYRQPPLCSQAHIDGFSPLGASTCSRQRRDRVCRDLRSQLSAAVQGSCSANFPALADCWSSRRQRCAKTVPRREGKDCCGVSQISRITIPPVRTGPWVRLAGSSASALRAASHRDRSPTYYGGQRDAKRSNPAQ